MKNIMLIPNKAFFLFVFFIIGGCSVPQYIPEKNEETARLNISKFSGGFCTEEEIYSIREEKEKYIAIPAGRKITLLSGYYLNNGMNTISCSVDLSFIPEKDKVYFAYSYDAYPAACFLEVFEETQKGENQLKLISFENKSLC